MPDIRVTIRLPYFLLLPPGDYNLPNESRIILDREIEPSRGAAAGQVWTRAYSQFVVDEALENDMARVEERRLVAAEQLLRNINRLLRWYRAVTGMAEFVELTRFQASPFEFTVVQTNEPWREPLRFEQRGPRPDHPVQADIERLVREGMRGNGEPDVATLFLLDADDALHSGRFREAVLFCWSTIDATFNRIYDQLVDRHLDGELRSAREFFKGPDFGLKNKMSAAMHLIGGRSLYREPDPFWENLTTSYTKRNAIIHRGELATEDDAQRAIQVARDVVRIMNGIAADNAL